MLGMYLYMFYISGYLKILLCHIYQSSVSVLHSLSNSSLKYTLYPNMNHDCYLC